MSEEERSGKWDKNQEGERKEKIGEKARSKEVLIYLINTTTN